MFKYKWPVDCGYVIKTCEATFNEGWNRLDSRKAAYCDIEKVDSENAIRWHFLVSYATPVIAICEVYNPDTYDLMARHFYVSDYFDVSPTTIHHVSRYLRDTDFTYYQIKKKYYDMQKMNIFISMLDLNTYFYRLDVVNLNAIVMNVAPSYHEEYIK